MKTRNRYQTCFESLALSFCILVAGIMLGYAWASWHWSQQASYLDWNQPNQVKPIQLNPDQANLVHKMNNLG